MLTPSGWETPHRNNSKIAGFSLRTHVDLQKVEPRHTKTLFIAPEGKEDVGRTYDHVPVGSKNVSHFLLLACIQDTHGRGVYVGDKRRSQQCLCGRQMKVPTMPHGLFSESHRVQIPGSHLSHLEQKQLRGNCSTSENCQELCPTGGQ